MISLSGQPDRCFSILMNVFGDVKGGAIIADNC